MAGEGGDVKMVCVESRRQVEVEQSICQRAKRWSRVLEMSVLVGYSEEESGVGRGGPYVLSRC